MWRWTTCSLRAFFTQWMFFFYVCWCWGREAKDARSEQDLWIRSELQHPSPALISTRERTND